MVEDRARLEEAEDLRRGDIDSAEDARSFVSLFISSPRFDSLFRFDVWRRLPPTSFLKKRGLERELVGVKFVTEKPPSTDSLI